MKIKNIDVALCGLFVAIFKIYLIPKAFQQTTKLFLLVCVLCYILSNIDIKKILNTSLVFGCSIILASIVGTKQGFVSFESIQNGILYAVCLFCIYTLLKICADKFDINRAVKCFYFMTIIYCVCSITSMIIIGRANKNEMFFYFAGNKFETCYYFVMLAAMYSINYFEALNKFLRNKIMYFILSFLAIGVGIWLYCSTAVVISSILLIAPFISKKLKKVLMNPVLILSIIIFAAFLLLLTKAIMDIPFIQYLIVNVLGEDVGLTGRYKIYEYLFPIIQKGKWFGFGYGNNIVRQTVGYGNAQNGLMQMVIDYGMIGVVSFLWTIYHCIHKGAKGDKYWGFYVILFAMIIASMVEISYSFVFFIALFFLRWAEESKQEKINIVSSKRPLKYR